MANKLRQVRLSTKPTSADIDGLRLGDIVYLDGLIYTAREGVYKHVLENNAPLPLKLPEASATTFNCSPAATIEANGDFTLGAVTATASFRFVKWIDQWMQQTQSKLIIGKGGMTSKEYREIFVPHKAVYLSTVGYGTGALLGRGVKGVEHVFWADELGMAQAMWVLRCENIGPFIVASNMDGECLFERENAKIAVNYQRLYEGLKPATLKRYGETDDRKDELIG